jgi:hypothetical protein
MRSRGFQISYQDTEAILGQLKPGGLPNGSAVQLAFWSVTVTVHQRNWRQHDITRLRRKSECKTKGRNWEGRKRGGEKRQTPFRLASAASILQFGFADWCFFACRFRPLTLDCCFRLSDLVPVETGLAADCSGGGSCATTAAGTAVVTGLSAPLNQNVAPTIVSSIAAQTAQILQPTFAPASVCFGSGAKRRPHLGHLIAKWSSAPQMEQLSGIFGFPCRIFNVI